MLDISTIDIPDVMSVASDCTDSASFSSGSESNNSEQFRPVCANTNIQEHGPLSRSPSIHNNDLVRKSRKRKDSLRKGKWIAEEETYTNKIIEYFNAGLLKIEGEDKNITLRAYLADKLDCDPMRITKKYSGASCLGKKAYHFDETNASVVEAMHVLADLEKAFRQRLIDDLKKKEICILPPLEESLVVSTPSIDALVKRLRKDEQDQKNSCRTSILSIPLPKIMPTAPTCTASNLPIQCSDHHPMFLSGQDASGYQQYYITLQ